MATSTFDEVLEAIDRLVFEDQEALVQVVRKRLAALRREQLVEDVLETRRDLQEGRCRRATADENMAEALS